MATINVQLSSCYCIWRLWTALMLLFVFKFRYRLRSHLLWAGMYSCDFIYLVMFNANSKQSKSQIFIPPTDIDPKLFILEKVSRRLFPYFFVALRIICWHTSSPGNSAQNLILLKRCCPPWHTGFLVNTKKNLHLFVVLWFVAPSEKGWPGLHRWQFSIWWGLELCVDEGSNQAEPAQNWRRDEIT